MFLYLRRSPCYTDSGKSYEGKARVIPHLSIIRKPDQYPEAKKPGKLPQPRAHLGTTQRIYYIQIQFITQLHEVSHLMPKRKFPLARSIQMHACRRSPANTQCYHQINAFSKPRTLSSSFWAKPDLQSLVVSCGEQIYCSLWTSKCCYLKQERAEGPSCTYPASPKPAVATRSRQGKCSHCIRRRGWQIINSSWSKRGIIYFTVALYLKRSLGTES